MNVELGCSGRLSIANARYSSTLPAIAPAFSGTIVATAETASRLSPRNNTVSGAAAPPLSRVSMPTRVRPKSGSIARILMPTGADGGTVTTGSCGSTIATSGARSGRTSIRCSTFSAIASSRCAAVAARGWNMRR